MTFDDALAVLRGVAVVEIGCGPGPIAQAAVGIDIDLGALRGLRSGMYRIARDAHQLPLAHGAVHAVVARGLLHHSRDLRRLLSEVRRVPAPGGVFLALDCGPLRERDFNDMTRQLYARGHPGEPRNSVAPSELHRLLRHSGFTDITSYCGGTWTNATPPFSERIFRSPAWTHRALAGANPPRQPRSTI
jgi:SAM-dependent methyltransferase